MIKAITFDLDGVYFVNGKENFIKNLGIKYGVSEDETKRVFLKSEEMNNLYKVGKMTDEEFWTFATREWKIEVDWKEIPKLMIEGYEVDEKVVEVVRAVRKNGYKTLICSSNFPARINGLQERFKFLNDFDARALSYEVGVNKPDKRLYEELIKKSGFEASEVVYSDDELVRTNAAKEVGLSAFLYENFEQFCGELKKLGVEW
ncbi:HAD-IA family hydrolase [Candidatus Shapirobacteria bacterium]|nr:HAD-IA family hydrolase [Candidatus Shapirobacteria bacterium]